MLRRPEIAADQQVSPTTDDIRVTPIITVPFELREDGSIHINGHAPAVEGIKTPPPRLTYSSDTPFLRLYHGNCLELLDLDAIHARHGDAGPSFVVQRWADGCNPFAIFSPQSADALSSTLGGIPL